MTRYEVRPWIMESWAIWDRERADFVERSSTIATVGFVVRRFSTRFAAERHAARLERLAKKDARRCVDTVDNGGRAP
jgi:hypothetical protein